MTESLPTSGHIRPALKAAIAFAVWFTISVTAFAQSVWSPVNTTASNSLFGASFGGGVYLATSSGGTVARSTDLITWIDTNTAAGFLQDGAYGAGNHYVVGSSGSVESSPDGLTWSSEITGSAISIDAVDSCATHLVAVGADGTILIREPSGQWQTRSAGTTQFLSGIAYSAGTYVAVGAGGTIVTSTDTVTWQTRVSATTDFLSSVKSIDDTFYAVGQNGTVLSSPDGVVWSAETSGTNSWLYDIEGGNGDFVAVGALGRIISSPDGSTWSTETSGVGDDLFGVAYGDAGWLAVGNTGSNAVALVSVPATTLPSYRWADESLVVEEGNTVNVVIERSGSTAAAGSIDVRFNGSSATLGADLTLSAAQVVFAIGQSQATMQLTVPDDMTLEGFEFGVLELFSPSADSALNDGRILCLRLHDPGDTDGDLLTDAWELLHFLDLVSQTGTGDPDNDGNDNQREEADATDPNDPLSASYFVTFTGTGAQFFIVPEQPTYAPDDVVGVFVDSDPGFTFLRWEGDVSGDPEDPSQSMQVNSDLALIAIMGVSLEDALDDPGATWATSGASDWFGQTGLSCDGVDSAQAGEIGLNGISDLTTTVEGPATVQFSWASALADPGDILRLFIDGASVATISGQSAWADQGFEVGAGPHQVRFVFQRGAAGSPLADAVWIDKFSTTPIGGESYPDWVAATFTAAEAANPMVSGADADPEGDNLANGLEYLIGSDPKQDDGSAPLTLSGQSGAWSLRYEVVIDHEPFATLTLEQSDDMVTWTGVPQSPTEISSGGGKRLLEVIEPAAVPRQFYRLTVEISE